MGGPGEFASQAPGVYSAETIDSGEFIHEYRGEIEGVTGEVRLLTLATDVTDEGVHDAFTRVAGQWHNPSTHPNIVSVHDRGTTPRPWLAVADPDGQPLDVIQPNLSIPDVRAVIEDVAEALRNANLYNTTHLDLTPQNVWVVNTDTGRSARVDDWGLERACRVAGGETPLTPYTAPELLDDPTGGTEQTDVYGLGAVAYYALTGQPPVTGTGNLETAIRDGDVMPPSEYADVPAGADDVIQTALARRPVDRQPSTYAFRTAIRNALPAETAAATAPEPDAGTQDGEDTAPTTAQPSGPDDETDTQDGPSVSRRGLLGFGILGVGTIGGVGYYLTSRGRDESPPTSTDTNRTTPSSPTPTTAPDTTDETPTETEHAHESSSPLASEATIDMDTTVGEEQIYAPNVVSIEPGGTVTWEATSGVHSATAYHPQNGKPQRIPSGAEPFDSGLLDEGESFSHTFETEGVYNYYSLPHENTGMVGTIIVGDPDTMEEPGMSDPEDELPQEARNELSALQNIVETELQLPMASQVAMRTTASDSVFTPELASIRRGGAVRWTDQSGVHSATAYHPDNGESLRAPERADGWNSGLLQEGETFQVNLVNPGVYDYYSQPHEADGMVGSIVVGLPRSLDDQPGLARPHDTLPDGAAEKLPPLNEQAREFVESNRQLTAEGGDGSELPDPNQATTDWLSDVGNYESFEDRTGQDSVTIDVGAEANAGAFGFGPPAVYVETGTTVTWEWTGQGGQHNVVNNGGSFESSLQASGSFEHTFEEAGQFQYFCQPHQSLGMKGAIIVTDGDGGVATETPGDSGDTPAEIQNWLSDVSNYDAVRDLTGQGSVTIGVGAQGNNGNFAFGPPAVRIDAGTTVTWEWTGKGGSHNVVDDSGSFESSLQASGSFEHTFDSPGTFKYFCQPHRALGMKGAIIVE
jgi:halocyanin-like protein